MDAYLSKPLKLDLLERRVVELFSADEADSMTV